MYHRYLIQAIILQDLGWLYNILLLFSLSSNIIKLKNVMLFLCGKGDTTRESMFFWKKRKTSFEWN